MFNLVHHHCHPFTDFYKGLTCAEPKPFLTVRKSDTLILWRAFLLVVLAGLDPRTYSIGTLQSSLTKCLTLRTIYHIRTFHTLFPYFFRILQDHKNMFSVYRKLSNMFQRSNHDQHDIFDHDHDHETPTGFIKIDNQIIFTQKFAKKRIQIYENIINVLKQLKNIKRVNEALKNEFH